MAKLSPNSEVDQHLLGVRRFFRAANGVARSGATLTFSLRDGVTPEIAQAGLAVWLSTEHGVRAQPEVMPSGLRVRLEGFQAGEAKQIGTAFLVRKGELPAAAADPAMRRAPKVAFASHLPKVSPQPKRVSGEIAARHSVVDAQLATIPAFFATTTAAQRFGETVIFPLQSGASEAAKQRAQDGLRVWLSTEHGVQTTVQRVPNRLDDALQIDLPKGMDELAQTIAAAQRRLCAKTMQRPVAPLPTVQRMPQRAEAANISEMQMAASGEGPKQATGLPPSAQPS